MAKQLRIDKAMEVRFNYFLYAYQKYVYNIFMGEQPFHIKVILGMEEHNSNPEILKRYLKEEQLTPSQRQLLEEWKKEVYGNMHIVGVKRKIAVVYCEETDQIYHTRMIGDDTKPMIKKMANYLSFHGTIFPIYGKLYLDRVINIQSIKTHSYQLQEDIYEKMYQAALRQNISLEGLTFSHRDIEKDKFSTIFLDYIGPLSPISITADELEDYVEFAKDVWNGETLTVFPDPELFKFLQARKQKYFSHIKRHIGFVDVGYYDGEIEVFTGTKNIEE